jgi:hypothetical protein
MLTTNGSGDRGSWKNLRNFCADLSPAVCYQPGGFAGSSFGEGFAASRFVFGFLIGLIAARP